MNGTNNTNSERFPIFLKTLGTVFTLPGIIGIAANMMVILAVFGKKTTIKRNTCTILLGSLAVEELFVSIHFVQCGLSYFIGWVWHPQLYCYLTQIPSVFALMSSSFIMLSIAIDRWLSLQFPLHYRKFNKKIYLSIMIGSSVVYGFILTVIGGLASSVNDIVPICMLGSAMHEWAKNYWLLGCLSIALFVIVFYTAAYLRVKISGLSIFKDEAHMKREKLLLGSLVILGVVYTFCWMTPTAIIFVMEVMGVSPTVFFHGTVLCGSLCCANASCNFFVYFVRSKEYRDEFLRFLGKKNVAAIQPTDRKGVRNEKRKPWTAAAAAAAAAADTAHH